MNRQTILLISDMRQVYLAEIMTKRGLNVRCLDIRNSGTVKEQLEKLKSFLAEADMLILPIPVTKIPEQKMLNDILNKNLTNDTLVLGGCFSTEQQELLERRDIHYLDFMGDEIVTEENAVATAEGVIAELVNHSPYNIEEAKIIVTGYGCCGRAVAARLKALGARVTVLARRREVRKLAKKDGFYAADFAFGPEEAMGAAMLVNTVPAPVVTGADHPRTAAGCIYFRHRVQTRAVRILPAPESAASVRIWHLDFRENMRRRRAPIFWTGRWRDSCERSMKCDGFFQL